MRVSSQQLKRTKLMEQIYHNLNHPAAYGSKKKLKTAATKHTTQEVNDYLKGQLAYTLHKPIKKKFPTRQYKTSGINDLWQMDLMEMIPYSRVNRGYKYILTCVDVFSRYARVQPLKTKKGEEVSKAISKMFVKNVTPIHIQTDLGKEFYNTHVRTLFQKHKIIHYTVFSQFKAALVERFNRTLREKLNRYFTHTGKKVWHNVLQTIASTYNKTKHRGVNNFCPADINKEDNEHHLWSKQQEQQKQQKSNTHIKLLDYVRVSRLRGPFLKNFDQNWSDEVFRVVAIDNRQSPVMYVIQDLHGELIKGKFYAQELQSIGTKPPSLYRIEKVIRTRGKGKHKQYLVKWLGYDSTHNSWISNVRQ